jgi:SAM-dependent methyltransferase
MSSPADNFSLTLSIQAVDIGYSLGMTQPFSPWTPFGQALVEYLEGHREAPMQVLMEDGKHLLLDAADLFCPPELFSGAEELALELCRGRVLDVGAGAGRHSLALQEESFDVTAIDICPQSVEVMGRRGVERALLGDVFTWRDAEPFETILLLMTGIGVVGSLSGLERLFDPLQALLAEGGQIVFDSWDPTTVLAGSYEAARAAERVRQGRYPGETRQQISYGGTTGASFDWLYVDPETVAARAAAHGLASQVVFTDDEGSYLARMVRAEGTARPGRP